MKPRDRWLLSVLFLLLFFLLEKSWAQIRAGRVCPQGWLYVNDQCWKFEMQPNVWDGARAQCQSQGSDLASIHTEEENRFLYSMMLKYGSNFGFAGRVLFDTRRFAQAVDLSCFQLTRNAVLVGFAQVASEVPSPEGCQMECLNAQQAYSFDCLSILYYPETRDCILNSASRTTEPSSFTTDTFGENVDYYENFCTGVQPTPRPPTPFPPTHEVVDRVTLEQCEQACLNSQQQFRLTCNSFVYYSAQQVCIINEATRRDYPNLFGPEQGADYYEKLPGGCPGTGPSTGCPTRDVMFIIDGSGSIGPQSFENIRRFLNLVISQLDVGFNQTNIGVIQFNEQPYTEFPLRSFQTLQEVQQAISSIQWRNGRTLIGRALQYALDNELLRTQGDRPSVPNVIVTLTDGLSQDNPLPPAEDMRTLGMTTYAIGVTDAVFDEQLLNIAGDPNRVYKVQDFSRLDARLRDALLQSICSGPGPQPPPPTLPPPTFPPPTLPPPIQNIEGSWVGLRDQFNQGNFRWSDSSPLDYTNWKFGQPDRRIGENCVVVEFEPLARWSDTTCDARKQFICKQPPSGPLNDFIKIRGGIT